VLAVTDVTRELWKTQAVPSVLKPGSVCECYRTTVVPSRSSRSFIPATRDRSRTKMSNNAVSPDAYRIRMAFRADRQFLHELGPR
jgi:hypothetical protein